MDARLPSRVLCYWVFAIAGLQQVRSTRGNQESTGRTAPVERQTQTAKDVASQAKDVAPEVWETSIKKEPAPESTIKELVQAWNKRNSEMIAALFLPDGVLRIPSGSEIRTREEIKEHYRQTSERHAQRHDSDEHR